MSAAMRRACSKLVAMPNRGAGCPAFLSTSPNSPRSSARVIALGLGAANRPAAPGEPLRQAERRLPAELDDHTDDAGTSGSRGGFGVKHLEHVLEGQWLEVQSVGRVIVGPHRFRLA